MREQLVSFPFWFESNLFSSIIHFQRQVESRKHQRIISKDDDDEDNNSPLQFNLERRKIKKMDNVLNVEFNCGGLTG